MILLPYYLISYNIQYVYVRTLGSVNVWHIDYGSTPIHHYKLDDSVSHLAIETERDLVVASSCCNSVRADISDANGQWQLATSFDLTHNVGIILYSLP